MRSALAACALLTAAFNVYAAEDAPRLPAGPEDFQLSVTVDEAVEEGPIVCTVTIRNVSKDRLQLYAWPGGNGGWCWIEADWKRRNEPLRRKHPPDNIAEAKQ